MLVRGIILDEFRLSNYVDMTYHIGRFTDVHALLIFWLTYNDHILVCNSTLDIDYPIMLSKCLMLEDKLTLLVGLFAP